MIEVLQIVIGVILISVMGYGCWISSVMLTERSKLRKYTGEYYDFDIDAKLKEMGLTREEALKYFDDWNIALDFSYCYMVIVWYACNKRVCETSQWLGEIHNDRTNVKKAKSI